MAVESLGRRELGEEALMEEPGRVEIRQQGELAIQVQYSTKLKK